MKKVLLSALSISVLAGCVSNTEHTKLDNKVQQLEINQRLLASRLKMTNSVMPSEIDFIDGIQIGNPNAPYVMIEFTDLQCPYCAKFQNDTFVEFKEKYVDTGEVLFVAREFPLKSIHPEATQAAVALRCTYEQKPELYSDMKATLFNNSKVLNYDFYLEKATEYQMNTATFERCLNSKETINTVDNSYKYAVGIGLNSTPSFVFGKNTGTSAADYRVGKGALSIENIQQGLDAIK